MAISIPSDDIPRKQCEICNEFFPATSVYFYRNPRQSDRLRKRCKTCSDACKENRKDSRRDGEKRCTKCKKWFPATLDYFWKCSRVKDGLESQCKNCREAYQEDRKDILKEYKHQHYLDHPEMYIRTREEQDRANALQRERHKANPEKYRTKANKRRHAKRDADPETYRANNRRRYENNPIPYKTNARNRKARKKAVPGTHTTKQIREQLKRQNYHCYYAACGFSKFSKDPTKTYGYDFEIEHTYPLSRVAGQDIPANDIGYIVLSCKDCNDKKGKRFPWEWPEGGRLL